MQLLYTLSAVNWRCVDGCLLQGSDEESDVDDEEREVERYDRQAADAECVTAFITTFVLNIT